MKKLIEMTDYVLEQWNRAGIEELQKYYNIAKYAYFLKQPLTLGDFIPCDENGNVLEEPKEYYDWYKWGDFSKYGKSITPKCKQYYKAKSKVIFEGFELKERSCNDSVFSYVENGLIAVYYFNIQSEKFEPNTDFKTIECLVPYNLTLTDNVKI